MEAVNFEEGRRFNLRGTCPHCSRLSVFLMMTGAHVETMLGYNPPQHRIVAVMQCQGCNNYILGIVLRQDRDDRGHRYEAHYPLGKPDDSVAEEIPDSIKPDFREALRCRWVDAYNATVEMCRRTLESSCLQLGADSKLTLEKMIDWVHEQGKITTPLKDMAHKVRLGGDRGAHPSERIIEPVDADAVIEFTREYFAHVYVMPAKMAKFDFSRPKPKKT